MRYMLSWLKPIEPICLSVPPMVIVLEYICAPNSSIEEFKHLD